MLITHSNFERSSIFLVRERIGDRKELRRLRKLPAMGMRGPDDLTDTGEELVCPGGLIDQRGTGFIIVWELRRWDPTLSHSPDAVERLSTWRHLIEEGFRITTLDGVERLMGWPHYSD